MTTDPLEFSKLGGSPLCEMYADVAVVTVTTRNYLYRARALLASVKDLIPGALRLACCVDPLENNLHPSGEDYLLVEASSLSLPRYPHLVLALNPTALCCALKPHAILHAFQQSGIKRVIYLDNDIGLYRTPSELLDALEQHSFVVTPHHLAPLPQGAEPNELGLNSYGIFNAGMFALRKCTEAMDFIEWWGQWLLDPRHLESHWGYDQAWLNYVPVYCPGAKILLDAGYNVAFWNILERDLWLDQGNCFCGSRPITAFHFSNFDENYPMEILSRGSVYCIPPTPATKALASQLAESWTRFGRDQCLGWRYGYECWSNGEKIAESQRARIKCLWDDLPPAIDLFSERFRNEEPEYFRQVRANFVVQQGGLLMRARVIGRRLLDVTPRKLLHRLCGTMTRR